MLVAALVQGALAELAVVVVGEVLAIGLAAIVVMLLAYGAAMLVAFHSASAWTHSQMLMWYAVIGLCQGVFGLFTMCLPPLFPTLLRTTGAGFCYNIGRVLAAA